MSNGSAIFYPLSGGLFGIGAAQIFFGHPLFAIFLMAIGALGCATVEVLSSNWYRRYRWRRLNIPWSDSATWWNR